MRTAAVLLSRQALRPCGRDEWVRKSAEAINWVKDRGLRLCSSCGMQTWDLLTSLGSIGKVRQLIVVPAAGNKDFQQRIKGALEQFELAWERTEFLDLQLTTEMAKDRRIWPFRDRVVVGEADLLVPVSIRGGGSMETLIEQERLQGKQLIDDFRIAYRGRSAPLAYHIKPGRLNPCLDEVGAGFLIHWTRTFNSAWPGERLIEYYRAVVSSDRYPRTAFDSLLNIATEKTIRASSRHMPSGTPTVSFSGRKPCEMAALMKWRARYREMSFEPYGIGIEKRSALALGVRPVNYRQNRSKAPSEKGQPSPAWLTQSGGVKADWTREDEYRFKGDLDLSRLDVNKVALFCHKVEEARHLERVTGIRALSFEAP
ncbi:MAG: hypothetical protein JSW34_09120 [Candidatus Zixiibacteriota bacterium]|nr:MAG: hypothetical protein JSW34_09120 [candidate division Zixibacteria bacterium]